MTAPDERPRPKRKWTKNGKLRGRPVKRSGADLPPVDPKKPRLERYFVRFRDPGYVLDPATGEKLARRFGPGVPVFEMREPVIGRPPTKNQTEVLWIVRAALVERLGLQAVAAGVVDWAKNEGATTFKKGRLVPAIGEGHSVEAVKRRLKDTLKQMEQRRAVRAKGAKVRQRVELDGIPGDKPNDTTT